MSHEGRISAIHYHGPGFTELHRAFNGLGASAWVGDRLCKRLREYDFEPPMLEEVSLFLVPEPPTHRIAVASPIGSHHGVRYGIDPADVEALAPAACDALLADITLRALLAICPDESSALERARRDFESSGANLPVEHLRKETREHLATISLRTTPHKMGPFKPVPASPGLFASLDFVDKKSGRSGSKVVLEYNFPSQLRSTIGSIVVKGGVVLIRPKRGHNFGTAIEVPISELIREHIPAPASSGT